MKSLLKIIFLFSILLTSFENAHSQIPQYLLEAKNFVLVNPYRITFDIVFTHTDSNRYEVAAWQYLLKVPQSFGAIGVGNGANSGFQYDSINGAPVSGIPLQYWPRFPLVLSDTINKIPYYILRLAASSLPGAGNGFILQQNVPYFIIRMKIISSTPFDLSNFNLSFRDSCSDNPVAASRTRVNSYIGNINTEITRCVNHSIDISGINLPPVSCEIRLAPEGLYNLSLDKLNRNETVKVYLRRTFSPYQIIDSATAVIDSNILTGNFIFSTDTPGGLYYIVIQHRNSIETWSKDGGENFIRGNNNYDLAASASQAYGDNMILKGSRYCIYSGDVNKDMVIDTGDLALIDNDIFNFITGSAVTDLNGDNIVDLEDMVIADGNAANLILVERPGLTFEMGKNLLKNNFNAGDIK